jgi:hypothetical protein
MRYLNFGKVCHSGKHTKFSNIFTNRRGKGKLSAQFSAQLHLTAVYSTNHIQNTLCVSRIEYLNLKTGDTYTYTCSLIKILKFTVSQDICSLPDLQIL